MCGDAGNEVSLDRAVAQALRFGLPDSPRSVLWFVTCIGAPFQSRAMCRTSPLPCARDCELDIKVSCRGFQKDETRLLHVSSLMAHTSDVNHI